VDYQPWLVKKRNVLYNSKLTVHDSKPILKERMLQAELESTNICCPVLNPQIVGGAPLPGVVTT